MSVLIFLFLFANGGFKLANAFQDHSESNLQNGKSLEENTITDKKMSNESYNSWGCSEKEEIQNSQLKTIVDMLNICDNQINVQSETPYKILVVGNAGAGKTTFVQFLAGDNTKLISKEVSNGTGDYIIEDGVKISSTIESHTLYPEELMIEHHTALTDTPGFSDTRSPTHELVAAYGIKKYLKNVKDVKIVILVTYNSLQLGVYKDDFIDLLRSINNFIKDIDKYKNSIALIATKVPNNNKVINETVSLIPDENIILSIAKFLINVKKTLQERLEIMHIGNDKEKLFISNAMKIVDNILEHDTNSTTYPKINIFRRPSESGSLVNITLLQDHKESLKETILRNIEFVKSSDSDIGYTLSNKAISYLDCLLKYINNKIIKFSSKIFYSVQNHYNIMIKNYSDIYILSNELNNEHQKLLKLKTNLEASRDFEQYLCHINKFLIHLKNSSDLDNYTDHIQLIDSYIIKIEQFNEGDSILSPTLWSSSMKYLMDYMNDSNLWYNFLRKIFEKLSQYEIQGTKNKFNNYSTEFEINSNNINHKTKLSEIQVFLSNSQVLMDDNLSSYFSRTKLDNQKINELEEVVKLTIKNPVNITCDKNGKLIVNGFFVKLSDIVENNTIRNYCGEVQTKQLIINVIHTFYIDTDIYGYTFENMMIIAPKWIVVGSRKIKLDGNERKFFRKTEYDNNITLSSYNDFNETNRSIIDGKDGKPGVPGQSGGNFFGIGLQFINGESLTISSNGGDGGSGMDGENGKNGTDGRHCVQIFNQTGQPGVNDTHMYWNKSYSSFQDAFKLSEPSILNSTQFQSLKNNIQSSFTLLQHPAGHNFPTGKCKATLDIYQCEGEKGTPGGKGGNGGSGGLGGHAGNVYVIGLNETSTIKIVNGTGKTGTPGQGGKGGIKGENGYSTICIKTNLDFKYDSVVKQKEYWKCFNIKDTSESLIYSENGKPNFNNNKIIQPVPTENYDFSKDLVYYLVELDNKKDKFLSNVTIPFKKYLMEKPFGEKNSDFWKLAIINKKF